MEKILQNKRESVKNIQNASYLMSTTYKMINEPKALLLISDHILSSFMSSVSALLSYERSKKTIPPYHENNESKLNCFRQHLVKKYNFEEYLKAIENIMSISKDHKSADIEFSRDKKYIICNNQFTKIDTLSEDDIKSNIRIAREFIEKVDRVTANE